MTTDDRTPEERLLSKKRLGSFYLDDVRALIQRAEAAEAALADRDRDAFNYSQRLQAAEAEVADLKYQLTEAQEWRDEVARLRDGLRERETLLTQAIEHMEFAHYPQAGDGTHLADPFDLMKQARALLADQDGAA